VAEIGTPYGRPSRNASSERKVAQLVDWETRFQEEDTGRIFVLGDAYRPSTSHAQV